MVKTEQDLNQYQREPYRNAQGRALTQRCFICDKPIDFTRDPYQNKWVRAANLVRHRRCRIYLKV